MKEFRVFKLIINAIIGFCNKLYKLNSFYRRLIVICFDLTLIPIAWKLSFWIFNVPSEFDWMIFVSAPITICIYFFTGQYKGLMRYISSNDFYFISLRNLLSIICIASLSLLFTNDLLSFTTLVQLLILTSFFITIYRLIIRDYIYKLNYKNINKEEKKNVVIYGAGVGGARLADSLKFDPQYNIICFIDDNSELFNRNIYNLKIRHPRYLKEIKSKIDYVLLAMPSISNSRRRKIVFSLRKEGLEVLQIPSLDDLSTGIAEINSLKPITIEDLLNRDVVYPNPDLLENSVIDSVVLVTGAGGSIGSELCKQILKLKANRLVILDNSEASLYLINQFLVENLPDNISIQSVLGNSCEMELMNRVVSDFNVDIIFHAAAYKHVPIVEANPIVGIANNVISTYVACSVAKINKINKFILISSDKAVRPTNIMGASKRLAEIVVQVFAKEVRDTSDKDFTTLFSIVRFGNVLSSSGSVVPLFKRQINNGGPVTITDEKIVRYFMTIEEASQLVLQASSLSQGDDLFLLDMGDPILIKDLAKQMIIMSGYTIRDVQNPSGDIEIVYTGLRPGEKLFEELLIDAESQSTSHDLIYRAIESSIPSSQFWVQFRLLQKTLLDFDENESLKILKKLVPEWKNIKS